MPTTRTSCPGCCRRCRICGAVTTTSSGSRLSSRGCALSCANSVVTTGRAAMDNQSIGEPTLLPEDDEVLGEPSFEILVRDGEPIVSGSYFIHPPLRAVDAEWDEQ